ncbi:MAG: LysM peptidoglycan-binding domain-containing protein [Geobacter sp.]|nr:LysM peptidoglycan-binding domain-containing protein [Geobacter sp.]
MLIPRGIAALLILLLPVFWGCAARVPKGMTESRAILEQTRTKGDDKILPAEYRSIEETVIMAEVLLKDGDDDEAERLFLLAWSKGMLLRKKLEEEKARVHAEKLLREEAERLKAEQKRLAEIEEQKRLAEEKLREEEKKRREREKEKTERERPLPPYYTVKRGETLPQIAARHEVYNDQTLWPLIYRANRDQIRDPRFISPGQVLRIPRNVSREDIAEARRFSAGKSFH